MRMHQSQASVCVNSDCAVWLATQGGLTVPWPFLIRSWWIEQDALCEWAEWWRRMRNQSKSPPVCLRFIFLYILIWSIQKFTRKRKDSIKLLYVEYCNFSVLIKIGNCSGNRWGHSMSTVRVSGICSPLHAIRWYAPLDTKTHASRSFVVHVYTRRMRNVIAEAAKVMYSPNNGKHELRSHHLIIIRQLLFVARIFILFHVHRKICFG